MTELLMPTFPAGSLEQRIERLEKALIDQQHVLVLMTEQFNDLLKALQ